LFLLFLFLLSPLARFPILIAQLSSFGSAVSASVFSLPPPLPFALCTSLLLHASGSQLTVPVCFLFCLLVSSTPFHCRFSYLFSLLLRSSFPSSCLSFFIFFFLCALHSTLCGRLARMWDGLARPSFEYFSLHVVGFSLGFQIYIALFDKKMGEH
jgi:hypothetical protein